MGPRRWSRGRARGAPRAQTTGQGFNGATAMEPWKRPPRRDSVVQASQLQWGHGDGAVEEPHARGHNSASRTQLQWGHGDGAVEEALAALRREHMVHASMGPRRWSRGREIRTDMSASQ